MLKYIILYDYLDYGCKILVDKGYIKNFIFWFFLIMVLCIVFLIRRYIIDFFMLEKKWEWFVFCGVSDGNCCVLFVKVDWYGFWWFIVKVDKWFVKVESIYNLFFIKVNLGLFGWFVIRICIFVFMGEWFWMRSLNEWIRCIMLRRLKFKYGILGLLRDGVL